MKTDELMNKIHSTFKRSGMTLQELGEGLAVEEQLVLGGSSEFCATGYDTRPNDVRSRFDRVRIDGQGGALNLDANDDGEITCDEVEPYVDALFELVLADEANCELGDE